MPNIKEIASLVYFGNNGLFGYLNSQGFVNVTGEVLWSSTHRGGDSSLRARRSGRKKHFQQRYHL